MQDLSDSASASEDLVFWFSTMKGFRFSHLPLHLNLWTSLAFLNDNTTSIPLTSRLTSLPLLESKSNTPEFASRLEAELWLQTGVWWSGSSSQGNDHVNKWLRFASNVSLAWSNHTSSVSEYCHRGWTVRQQDYRLNLEQYIGFTQLSQTYCVCVFLYLYMTSKSSFLRILIK